MQSLRPLQLTASDTVPQSRVNFGRCWCYTSYTTDGFDEVNEGGLDVRTLLECTYSRYSVEMRGMNVNRISRKCSIGACELMEPIEFIFNIINDL